jgi:DNA-directed RNA polymerase beta' subunit
MNLHVPQSKRTQAEVQWLCAVDNQIRSPKNSGATIGLVQVRSEENLSFQATNFLR